MRKIRILQAKASNGARLLVGSLREQGYNALRTKVNGSAYRGYPSHLIINWGRSEWSSGRSELITLNKPEAVANACDKRRTFRVLSEQGMESVLPRWTTDNNEARGWFDDGVEKVYCRTLTSGSQGRGIVVAKAPEEIVHAGLYTGGVLAEREIRVHVFKREVIDYAQKKKLSSESRAERGIEEEPDEDIRNHANGWIFARAGVEIPETVKTTAVEAIHALGLDFGAVDMIITPQGVGKILEINTAPGLEGTTLESYTEAICGLQ